MQRDPGGCSSGQHAHVCTYSVSAQYTASLLIITGQQRNIVVGSGRQECKTHRKMQNTAESWEQSNVLIMSYTALVVGVVVHGPFFTI